MLRGERYANILLVRDNPYLTDISENFRNSLEKIELIDSD